MDSLYTLVADGDPDSRHHLAQRLGRLASVTVVDHCDTALGAARALRARPVHLLVIHAALPPDGAQKALDRLSDDVPAAVVVVSAQPGDGLWAYGVGAVDCLPDPVSEQRLRTAIDRARDRVLNTEIHAHRTQLLALLDGADASPALTEAGGRPLVIRSGSQLLFLRPSEVDWVEASGVYVNIHAGAKDHLLRETLRRVEESLDPNRFVRIHRSTLINLDRVRKIVPHINGGAIVFLKDGTQLRMSRSYREQISASLG